ncbi:MAG: 1-deoxy-D-xylulose-5-phosphate reductoisomerase [Candidatus Omnitrophica bacterium]|nr:1-deoxy-D-xylulose-5-phosphate reductoisomerase [Candidatus Omnitrophota bacterium]MDD5236719.1 1-deoxy-D-xylulose-5-phosphate reductoisomerase [Candidatus Omnitrophota bacterium]MDD5610603.1 1-deoxy-D-xylulose-5-phosphate reductoisomerase [Candidatus Omnitrophota bacterium]
MKRIAILGSTGSIGRNTLEVLKNFPGEFSLVGLSAYSDTGTLIQQIERFHPKVVSVVDKEGARTIEKKFGRKIKVLAGTGGLNALAQNEDIDLIVMAISGAAALLPLIRAVEKGKDIALANKEALVMAGEIIMRKARQCRAKILPVDSEQSAIWQCLEANNKNYLRKIYLTASGGPLRDVKMRDFKKIRPADVLKHPCWKMGKKITVDSATLMNKGLEVIEAVHLFSIGADKIEILIHPEVVIHSMVEFVDRSILAQLAYADMRIPIQYAMSYPKRLSNGLPGVDFLKFNNLSFAKPDEKRFPCLRLAYQAAKDAGTAPCALNAADEVAVDAFLNKKIDFVSIPRTIEKVLNRINNITDPGLEDILRADQEARAQAMSLINN